VADFDIARELQAYAELPRFPDGRIDFSGADQAPVLSCFVSYRGKILLLKRSARVRGYQGKWGTVAGYLDEPLSLEEKAGKELRQETGITRDQVERFVIGEPYTFKDDAFAHTWHIFPMLAVLKVPVEVAIDWEHTDYKWVEPLRLTEYDTVPRLAESLQRALRAL
jgi:8-oxo-dGTP pyrophosphatase MutT (NUDIX family)